MHTDQAAFRSLVVLLEDTKIRQYKLEDRTALRAVQDPAWESAFTKVCVLCVFGQFTQLHMFHCSTLRTLVVRANTPDEASRTALVDWLLGYAVSLEYSDNGMRA